MTEAFRVERASALLVRHRLRLRTGCDAIDALLGGGIPARGITEISGESSAGKTQLALQLVFQVQLPSTMGGLQGGALFLHTEGGEPPMKRLRQIGSACASKWESICATVDLLCEHIYVEKVETADLLLSTLRYRVPALLASRRVRLVVVDSVGALFRTHLDDDLPRRAELLVELAAEMKRLSDSMDVAFVVVNQVTDTVDDPTAADAASAASVAAAPGAKRAALGLAWSHCVNTRILLSRTRPQMLPLSAPQREQHDLATAQLLPSMSTERRTLRLLLSPSVEQGSCEYVINSGGISDVGPAAAADGRTFAY